MGLRSGQAPPYTQLLYNTKIHVIDSESPESTWSSQIAARCPVLLLGGLLAHVRPA